MWKRGREGTVSAPLARFSQFESTVEKDLGLSTTSVSSVDLVVTLLLRYDAVLKSPRMMSLERGVSDIRLLEVGVLRPRSPS